MAYPSSVNVFPTRSDGQTIFASHLNLLQTEVAALEASIVGGALPTPITIAGPRSHVVMQAAGGTTKARTMAPVNNQLTWGQNLYYDGVGPVRDDTTKGGSQLIIAGGTTYVSTAAPGGGNPTTKTEPIALLVDGSIRERSRSFGIGETVDIAYNAANMTAGSGTWTTTAPSFKMSYALVGRTCLLFGYIGPTTTSLATAYLRLSGLPITVVQGIDFQCQGFNGATAAWAPIFAQLTTTLTFYASSTAAGTWPAGSNVFVTFSVMCGI